jgi:hypothetical protein
MAPKSDMKNQLEAILGYKVGDDTMQFIKLVQSVASSTVSDGSTTQKSLLIARPNSCYRTRLLDVSGFWITGPNGKSVFRLTDFICHTGEVFSQPINVVATPLGSTPFFLTVIHALVNNGADVEITVSAWDAGGAAAPNVWFDWRCRVEMPIIIL